MDDCNKFQQMQDEMSRFEAEIGGGELVRPVIGAGTFGAVQQRLENAGPPGMPPGMQTGMPPGMQTGMPPGMSHSMPSGMPRQLLPPPPMMSYEPALARMLYPVVPPPPPPPNIMVPASVGRMGRTGGVGAMGAGGAGGAVCRAPESFPGPQLLPAPRPQPAVLSAAPRLYKQRDDRADRKRKRERESQPQPPAGRASPPPLAPPAAPPAPPAAPPAAPSLPPAPPPPSISEPPLGAAPKHKKEKKNRKVVRTAGGQVWEDVTLLEWPDDDFRMFCGDLGNDVTDELLTRTFSKYSSFQRAKVVRDKRTNKSKGFGFVSFKDPGDFIKAMKEMDGRYVGSRPIKLRKSSWKNRALDVVRKKEKEKAALLSLLMSGNKS